MSQVSFGTRFTTTVNDRSVRGSLGCGAVVGLIVGISLATNISGPAPVRPTMLVVACGLTAGWVSWRYGDRIWRWILMALRFFVRRIPSTNGIGKGACGAPGTGSRLTSRVLVSGRELCSRRGPDGQPAIAWQRVELGVGRGVGDAGEDVGEVLGWFYVSLYPSDVRVWVVLGWFAEAT